MSETEDNKKMAPDLANGSGIQLVVEDDGSVPKDDQNPRPSTPLLTNDDNNLELPAAGGDRVMTDDHTPAPAKLHGAAVELSKGVNDNAAALTDQKRNGRDILVEIQPKAATPPSPNNFFTPTAVDNIVVHVNNDLNDTEMAEAEAEDNGMPEDGTTAERAAFMRELEIFYRDKALEFKPPKFYGKALNCLKLWRAVIRLGGYDVVTASKLWRQVGESFHPPKTCTTVSWTFRIFYEKALLEYEKHKRQIGEIQLPIGSFPQPTSVEKEASGYQAQGSGRARRDAFTRAMQGWHAQRLGYGEVAEPIIKEKNLHSTAKREKNLKSIGSLKHKTSTNMEHAEKTVNVEADKQVVSTVLDVGPPADWVKINVRETKDCFEVYALVPGLLREEVRVQSDPAGRLVITGQPEQLDNPWGITEFKKVVSLPARIDPLHTSAVVSLHGRLFVRVPFEQG